MALLLSLFVLIPSTEASAKKEETYVFLVCKNKSIALQILDQAMTKMPPLAAIAVQTRICKGYPASKPRDDWRNVTVRISPTKTDFQGDPIAVFEFITKAGQKLYLFIINPDAYVGA